MAPSKGNPRHAFRFTPDLWAEFTAAVERDTERPEAERNQTAVLRDFIRWYVRERGVKLTRPPRQ